MFPGTSFQLVSLPPSSLSLPLSFPLFHAPLFFTDSSSRSGSAFRNPIPRDGKKLNVRVSRTVVLSNLSTVHSRYPRIVVTFFLAVVGRETKKRANWQDLDENGARGREEKRREEKREQATGTLPAHGTRFCLSGRRAGRLITVAFCGFVARHDPRAFRGPHCSASNRSRNGAERSFFVGELVDSRVRRCPFTRRVHRRHNLRHFLFVPLRFLFYDSLSRETIARAKSNIREQCPRTSR